ncbi:Golgi-associated RAB2 interactor protein 2 [Excalfactoria chinensis]|uniref:Golgi-associated RAB2 interactor protein 2 n=1 Tax=Excalfactoria chinensis TaxID=46218 RepID=UPI003B3A7192
MHCDATNYALLELGEFQWAPQRDYHTLVLSFCKTSSEFGVKEIISSQKSIMGDLQRLLNQGEYALFASAPMLESSFVQINQRGELINLHNRPTCMTIGICAANSPMPSGILLAHKVPVSPQEIMANLQKFSKPPSQVEQLALSRFLPLKFVELSVHNTDKKQLMLKLVNGRSYYLELCAPPHQQQQQFHHWLKLISLLKSSEDTSNTNDNTICEDSGTSHKKAPSPENPTDNSNNSNPKTEEEVVTEQTPSNQVPHSGSVGPTEKERERAMGTGTERASFSSSKETIRAENTMQSKNKDPLDTVKRRSKETRKSRTEKTKSKKEKTKSKKEKTSHSSELASGLLAIPSPLFSP